MTQERCESCYAGAPVMPVEEVQQQLSSLNNWVYDESECRLRKVFQFKGYYKTIAFVNAIAWIAQQQQHHPDLEVTYNTVTVCFQTHAANGVTTNDFICARHVDALGGS